MKVLLVHPSPLMYSEIYLRLEPLGLERVAGALRLAGHDVRMLDLQVFRHRDHLAALRDFEPDAVGYSLNYLANCPEVIDLARVARRLRPEALIFVGGHSASFVAREILEHAEGAIDCVARGEGEPIAAPLVETGRSPDLASLPGVVSLHGDGPPPLMMASIDSPPPARDLAARRNRYFIGELDPCASIEFTRGCPWDCSFCSAWTFYGRSYRKTSVDAIIEDLERVREPNLFIVDDVAFVHAEDGYEIGRAIESRRIRKRYYLETRCDVLLRHPELFEYWKKLGLTYMFLGIEALDEEGLKLHRKRVHVGENFRALEVARKLGLVVAVNVIADPSWDEKRFAAVREWAMSVPEIVHLTVATPYPGTELWLTESRNVTTLDYRLYDVQHAVLPTALPLRRFYEELVATQAVLNRKHLGLTALRQAATIAVKLLLKGQTNFLRMLWKFESVYDAARQTRAHEQPVRYAMRPRQGPAVARPERDQLYVHAAPAPRRPLAAATPAAPPAPLAGGVGD